MKSKTQQIQLMDLNSELRWVNHPIADLSILPITNHEILNTLDNRFYIIDKAHFELGYSRETELTVLGFPHGLGIGSANDVLRFNPLSYRSFVSSDSVLLKRADADIDSEFILLENPSVQGYSGGPVIDLGVYVRSAMALEGKRSFLYGIVHGTLNDATGGKITMVTPIRYLFDLIEGE